MEVHSIDVEKLHSISYSNTTYYYIGHFSGKFKLTIKEDTKRPIKLAKTPLYVSDTNTIYIKTHKWNDVEDIPSAIPFYKVNEIIYFRFDYVQKRLHNQQLTESEITSLFVPHLL